MSYIESRVNVLATHLYSGSVRKWCQATTAFLELVLDDGAKLEAPGPRPKLRMEVYGDSISTGLGCDRKRGKEHSREATDNFFSYGSITARNIGAEFRCISKSGIGLIKSWWPTIMPQYYDRACATSLEGAGEAWDFSQWQVDLVVINIFQNDSWTRKNTTSEEGVSAYIGFVKKLRGHYPESRIVCVLGSMDASKGKWAGFVKQAVQNLKEGGDKEVHSYIFRKQTGYRHPNRGDHERMAEELTAFIKTLGEIKPDPRVEAGTGYQEAYETAVAKAAGKDYHASLLLHAAALRKYGSEAAPSRLKIAEFKKDALAVKAVEMREFMIKAQDDYRQARHFDEVAVQGRSGEDRRRRAGHPHGCHCTGSGKQALTRTKEDEDSRARGEHVCWAK